LPLVSDLLLRPALNRGRVGLGLPPLARPASRLLGARMLVAADSELAPGPAALPAGSLRTEPWIAGPVRVLDSRLTTFINAGAPPVYIGFGSMVAPRSVDLEPCAIRAAQLTGRRLIVAGGWASLGEGLSASDDVLVIPEAPHEALFPRVAAAVHHGGAGTTTAAARAGIPQVIVPHMLDQFYWAHRVAALGLGPAPLTLGELSADRLAGRIGAVFNTASFRARASDLAQRAVGRDGVPDAVRFLERAVSCNCTNELVL
jgi:vancomycin aglycone glucosyltransferase